MRAEELKREACEVLRFRSHKYSQEGKARQSACDTSAETRRRTARGGEGGVNNSAQLLSRLFVKRCQKRLRTQGVLGGGAQSIWSTFSHFSSLRPLQPPCKLSLPTSLTSIQSISAITCTIIQTLTSFDTTGREPSWRHTKRPSSPIIRSKTGPTG